MLTIAIPKVEIPLLNSDGCTVTINGEQTVLRREGDYLCYGSNRCKILDEYHNGESVDFSAASHGAENEPHVVIRPEVIEFSEGDAKKLLDGTAKLVEAESEYYVISEQLNGEEARSFACTIAGLTRSLVTAIENELREGTKTVKEEV